jgi:hypothetical protein
MENKDSVLKSGSREQIIREAEPTATIEKVTEATKKAVERKTANDIAIFVQNFDDFEDSDAFIMLYVKAVNNSLEYDMENYRIDENEVRKIIAETDERFVYGEEVCDEYEDDEEIIVIYAKNYTINRSDPFSSPRYCVSSS